MKVTKKRFVEIWQKSRSVSEVVTKSGLAESTVKKYAWQFRRRGVPLAKLEGEGKPETDWDDLVSYAKSLNGSDGGDVG